MENPGDWKCPCGFPVWARKDCCPKCNEPRTDGDWAGAQTKGQIIKEQEAQTGGTGQPTQQA
eukprot:3498824-Heterocapsa_arctica.AAC.1